MRFSREENQNPTWQQQHKKNKPTIYFMHQCHLSPEAPNQAQEWACRDQHLRKKNKTKLLHYPEETAANWSCFRFFICDWIVSISTTSLHTLGNYWGRTVSGVWLDTPWTITWPNTEVQSSEVHCQGRTSRPPSSAAACRYTKPALSKPPPKSKVSIGQLMRE